jgi:diguanylate cyclase (GGDEF)-like protein
MEMVITEFTSRQLAKMSAELDQLRRENERLLALTYRDPLTGLRNRRFFSERLSEELCRAHRGRTVMSVICVDLNGFKDVNDTQGHHAGDNALIAVGRFLESLTRAEDLCCRLGGDEFTVLLPDTDENSCRIVVDRLRQHQAALAGTGLGQRGLAVGMASFRAGDDEVRLLARADEEMYADKRASRDEEEAPVAEVLAKAA